MAPRKIPTQDKIEYLIAAIECAVLMRDQLPPPNRGGWDSKRDREKLQGHIDGMLETLSALYLEHAFEQSPSESEPEPA